MKIVLATNNNHKIEEIKSILNFKVNEILSLKDINFTDEIEELGQNYYENSRIKAEKIFEKIKNNIILSDDSGLEIEYFNNEPGVYSARFMPELTQKEKNKEIIKRMSELKDINLRAARFISVVCCILPNGSLHFFKGICNGHIAFEIQGENGFGYDPIFIPLGFNKSFGALSIDIKNTISHRAQSFNLTKEFIVKSNFID